MGRMMVVAVLLAAGTTAAPVHAQQTVAAAGAADAYADAAARELVREARARRVAVDTRIEAYETTVLERISMALSAGLGERLLYRRETASRIQWTRDTVRIDVLGAREVLPAVKTAPQIPADLSGYVPALAFDPVDSEMLLRFDTTMIRHPLSAGSEAHYRFASGDSTVIRLPDGRSVTLHELRITPRRRDPQLISGSFWVDARSHAVVQAYFRLARGYDSRRDSRSGRAPLLLPAVHAELDYIAIDYGLWDLRWWLPRTVAARGLLRVGPLRMPMSYERRYDDYAVRGDTTRVAVDTAAALAPRLCRPRTWLTIQATVGEGQDTTVEERRQRPRRDRGRRPAGATADSAAICDREFIVTRAAVEDLMTSELLPGDAYAGGSAVIDEAELRAIAARVRGIPGPPWQFERPVLQLGPTGPGLVRYNRVEGLSVGARALFDFGAAAADVEVRIGTASGEVGAEAGAARPVARTQGRLAAYRRLTAVDVTSAPFSVGSSASALLLGRDDDDYFRATGAELTFSPPSVRRQWYEVRVFAEAQRPVEARTDFSVPHLLDSARGFRANIQADRADQVGAAIRLRAAHGYDPADVRAAAELTLHGEAGDYRFFRPALAARATAPVGPFGPRLTFAVEAAGGTSFGDPPAQRLWQLGGVGTLRGYDGGSVRGETFWRSRLELGLGPPLARLAVFGDAGWAGPRSDIGSGRPLRSAGAGLSLLDGLFRLDVARALDAPRGWKLHFQLDGAL